MKTNLTILILLILGIVIYSNSTSTHKLEFINSYNLVKTNNKYCKYQYDPDGGAYHKYSCLVKTYSGIESREIYTSNTTIIETTNTPSLKIEEFIVTRKILGVEFTYAKPMGYKYTLYIPTDGI